VTAGYGVSAVLHLETCGSTNKEAMRLAHSGETGPLWVCARLQSEGRGRSGRKWVSKQGNLFASLLVRLKGPMENLGQLSLVAGIAVADAITLALTERGEQKQVGKLWLKWPNDIMFGPAKCGGLLVETSTSQHDEVANIVIGVGLNLAHGANLEDRATSCLSDHGLEILPTEILAYLDQAMLLRLHQWDRGNGFSAIRASWLAMAGKAGRPITVHEGANVIKGRFEGLSQEGRLLVRLDGGTVKEIAWGDVLFP